MRLAVDGAGRRLARLGAVVALVLATTAVVRARPISGVQDAARGRWVPVELELVGPLEGVELSLPGLGRTTLDLRLERGETRRVEVPLPGRPLDPALAPHLVVHPDPDATRGSDGPDSGAEGATAGAGVRSAGRARFLRWVDDAPDVAHLLRRGTPGAARPVHRLGRSGALALAVLWVGVLALLRRPRLALALGLVGALGLGLLVRAESPARPPEVRVLEGRTGSDGRAAWWELRVGRGGLASVGARPGFEGLGGPLHLRTQPIGLPLHLTGAPARGFDVAADPRHGAPSDAEGGDDARAAAGATEKGGGADPLPALPDDWRVEARRPAAPGLRGLTRAANTWGDLEAVWTRDPDGTWHAHGPWPVGEPLPAPLDPRPGPDGASEAPPGWGVSGLPLGLGVLLAREAPAAPGLGPEPTGRDAAAPSWVRLIGF